jgi:hypothetical protein
MIARSVLSFLSVLAFGAMTVAAMFALGPWLSGHMPEGARSVADGLQFSSLIIGLVLGLTLGAMGRYDWADIPRRAVTWFLVREQRFFYYLLIAVCAGVLILY